MSYDRLQFWLCKGSPKILPFASIQFEYLSNIIIGWDNLSLPIKLSLCRQYEDEIIAYYNLNSSECDCGDDECHLKFLK
jgi:hypothetical protein